LEPEPTLQVSVFTHEFGKHALSPMTTVDATEHVELEPEVHAQVPDTALSAPRHEVAASRGNATSKWLSP
jgi:hypothetical protein